MRRQKIIIILVGFIFSNLGFTQNTNFTEEENQYVKSILTEFDNTEGLTYIEAIEKLSKAMKVVPYHPKLVYSYLYANDLIGEKQIVLNYCQNELDEDYLKNNQDILEICNHSAIVKGDLGYAESNLSLVKDPTTKYLFKASIAYDYNQINDFLTFGLKGIEKEYDALKKLKQFVINHLIIIYYADGDYEKIDYIFDNYYDIPEKLVSGFDTMVILNLRAFQKENYKGGLEIIKMAEAIYPEYNDLLAIFKAGGLATQGHDYLAEEALNTSLKTSEKEINNTLNFLEIDYFNLFFDAIIKIEDTDIKIKLLDGLHQNEEYRNKAILLMAYVYAEKDISKSEAYFKEFSTNASEIMLGFFQDILVIEYEMNQKKPDFNKISKLLDHAYTNTNEAVFFLRKAKIQLKENAISDNPEFDYESISLDLKNLQSKNSHNDSFNEILELLLITSTYFTNKDEAYKLLSNCKYCENYDVEFMSEAIEEENDALVVYFLDKIDVLEKYYTEIKEILLKELLYAE